MQLVGRTASLTQEAMRRAQRLDAVIQADGILSGTSAEFAGSVDILSENLTTAADESDATEIIPEASLVVERANTDGAKSFQSTRTILSAGARRSFGDWALGWKVGAYYDDVELSGADKGDAQGVFASVSAVREFGRGLFGQAPLRSGASRIRR